MFRPIVILSTLLLAPWLAQGAPQGNSIESRQTSTSSYWLSQIQRQGTIAYADDGDSKPSDPSSYKVYRSVKDYGAVGDGVTDDFDAINRTMFDGGRCGSGCNSSTIQPALVYFPPGTYSISKPIVMPYYTQMVGDAVNPPTIKGSSNFEGIALIDSNPYYPGISNPDGTGINWYRNQNNFFRQVRNFKVDLTGMPEVNPDGVSGPAGLHWQVAQATSLQNIVFQMKPKSGTNKQQGIYMENGSGGFMTELVFNGGAIGMAVGNQQFTTRNLTFNGCQTAILIGWDWLWTFKSLKIDNADIGIDMGSLLNGNNQSVGSVVLVDGAITNSVAGIKTSHNATSQPDTGGTLTVQNVDFTGTQNAIVGADGVKQILAGGAKVDLFVQGDAYVPPSEGSGPARAQQLAKRLAQAEPSMSDCDDTATSTYYPIPGTVTAAATDAAMSSGSSPVASGASPSNVAPNSVAPNNAPPYNASSSGTAPNATSPSSGAANSTSPTVQLNGTCTSQAIAAQQTKLQQQWNKVDVSQSLSTLR